jgi:RNA polymerase sigma-70 factor, ECF subfamily
MLYLRTSKPKYRKDSTKMEVNKENFIRTIKRRDERGLYYVIDTYGWLIKSIVKKHIYNLDLQNECINDILLAVWFHIGSFNSDKGTFENWIGAVSKYKCINFKRKHLKLLETQNIDDLNLESDYCIENEVIKNQLSCDMENLLNNLNDEDKKLFLMHYVEEKDVRILSKEMDIRTSALYNRLSRGRSKLRAILENKEI